MDNEVFRPPPEMSVSEWADEYRFLSREASPEAGKWRTSRAPYQRAMMDAVKSSERIVIMTAAQIGKTELLLNVIGYFIAKDPSPILLLQPTLGLGETFSKDRLAPMIRDCPALTGLIADPKARDSGNTLLHKNFPGGHITIAGANSPVGLASRPIRVLLCDEVDRYPLSAGSEGDPLALAEKRTANFWNRRIVLVSTPTQKGWSRIEEVYEQSTCEEWSVPCPVCGELQAYSWPQMVYKERTEPVMRCVHCGQESGEVEWKSGVGTWVPGAVSSTRGFHLNAFASPWVRWEKIVSLYHEAYASGEEMLKVWTNTILGEPWEDTEGVIELESLGSNREEYSAEVPDEVKLLTAGVDTQDDRLECEVVGWGVNNQSWGIEYKVIYGDPGGAELWRELDEFLLRVRRKLSGEGLSISCVCVDSGGHYTDAVYKYCKGRTRRRVFPIVGRGRWGMASVSRPSRNNRARVPLFTLGVSTLKGVLASRLKAERGEGGYCHFPSNPGRGYDEVYFQGLLSERMVIRRERGRDVVRFELLDRKTRNEPLDCRVYAMGAYEILNPDMTKYEKAAVKKAKPRRMVVRRGVTI